VLKHSQSVMDERQLGQVVRCSEPADPNLIMTVKGF
jgi:hypothetical protein